jgi:hypothetical protein
LHTKETAKNAKENYCELEGFFEWLTIF